MKLRNPVLAEGVSLLLSHRKAMRSHMLFLLTLSLVLIAGWPGKPITAYLTESIRPLPFGFVSIVFFLFIVYFSVRYTTVRFAIERFHPTVHWLEHTPVSRGRILLGKTAVGAIHLLLLTLIALPFLIIAGSASGVPLRNQAVAAGFILLCGFTYRAVGTFLSLFLDEKPFRFYSLLWSAVILLGFLSLFFAREINPISILFRIMGEDLLPPTAAGISDPSSAAVLSGSIGTGVRVHLVISASFTAASYILIHLLPGRNRRPWTKRTTGPADGESVE